MDQLEAEKSTKSNKMTDSIIGLAWVLLPASLLSKSDIDTSRTQQRIDWRDQIIILLHERVGQRPYIEKLFELIAFRLLASPIIPNT
jgi:hypothetical protein